MIRWLYRLRWLFRRRPPPPPKMSRERQCRLLLDRTAPLITTDDEWEACLKLSESDARLLSSSRRLPKKDEKG